MADSNKPQGLLWMFRRPESEGSSASLDPSGTLYGLFKNTRNPFLRRAIAPQAERGPAAKAAPSGAGEAADLSRLVQFFADRQRYEAAPANRADPYTRRQLQHPAPPPARNPSFQDPTRLPGDPQRLPPLVDDFFQGILSRLRADPQSFAAVVQELAALLQQHGITLRIYAAYQSLEDWDDLMDTLGEIARFPSVETFDLFCGALLAYHDLVYGTDA